MSTVETSSGFIDFMNTITTYSPLIIASIFTSLSFIFQNFKGILYLALLLINLFLRTLYINFVTEKPIGPTQNPNICKSLSTSSLDNGAGFNMFVYAFTAGYVFLPMFLNNSINFLLLVSFMVYASIDMIWKYSQSCIVDAYSVPLNLIIGLFIGCACVFIVSTASSQSMLFFNEYSSDKEMCSMTTKQKFKCAVYKNGELISTTTK
jgi:hypothetical protein